MMVQFSLNWQSALHVIMFNWCPSTSNSSQRVSSFKKKKITKWVFCWSMYATYLTFISLVWIPIGFLILRDWEGSSRYNSIFIILINILGLEKPIELELIPHGTMGIGTRILHPNLLELYVNSHHTYSNLGIRWILAGITPMSF